VHSPVSGRALMRQPRQQMLLQARDALYSLLTQLRTVGARQVKPKKKKKPSKASVEKPLTQDEMLMQAAFTEIHNGRWALP